ncbi:hypothetical protein DOY81_010877 [Sarcophaga bullata]|nr:hypothetical protein DOY81_010877 [Sarcophaga bullata]
MLCRNSYLPADRKKTIQTQDKLKITTVKTTSQTIPNLQASLSKLASETYQGSSKNKSVLLKLLAECHEILGKCVEIVARQSLWHGCTFHFNLLFTPATSYFLFIELLSKKDNGYVWLQVLWILFHSCRLLLVVEPCHRILMNLPEPYINIICEIERIVHDPILSEEVKKFWQQLLVLDNGFSACGLCQVNRQLLTSLASAIATYLVILIQFQRSNG